MNCYVIKSENEIDFAVISECEEQEVKKYLVKANEIFYEQEFFNEYNQFSLEEILKGILPDNMTLISGYNVHEIYN